MPVPPCPEAGKMFAGNEWHKMEKFTPTRAHERALRVILTPPTGATKAEIVSYDPKWLGAVVPLRLRP